MTKSVQKPFRKPKLFHCPKSGVISNCMPPLSICLWFSLLPCITLSASLFGQVGWPSVS